MSDCLDRPSSKIPVITKGADVVLTFTIRDSNRQVKDITGAVNIVLKLLKDDNTVEDIPGTLVSGINGKISVAIPRATSALLKASPLNVDGSYSLSDAELIYEIGAVKTVKNLPQSIRVLNPQFP